VRSKLTQKFPEAVTFTKHSRRLAGEGEWVQLTRLAEETGKASEALPVATTV
jgi:hypothetical protein